MTDQPQYKVPRITSYYYEFCCPHCGGNTISCFVEGVMCVHMNTLEEIDGVLSGGASSYRKFQANPDSSNTYGCATCGHRWKSIQELKDDPAARLELR